MVGVVTGGGGAALVGVVADETAPVELPTGVAPKVVTDWGFSW